MFMSTDAIRRAFLSFFESKGHQIVESSSLIPYEDPTLLFSNAGMNQFKDCFLGIEKRSYTRAASVQRCVRAGGKHNDLEKVGFTNRHHTFFEMLGNFSFGDYFKEEAIEFSWEFLTNVLRLPKERFIVTVYETDDEAFDIWNKGIGLGREKIIRIGGKAEGKPFESDNFWHMGNTGPCGPSSEIFYDRGEGFSGTLPGSPREDGGRFIEIWNNVFMQFNRQSDGSMHPLPEPSVDTGMGIERVAAIVQNVNSNYEIDIFQSLIKEISRVTGSNDLGSNSLHVIADHIRACAYLIVDGVTPSNEGRGYVLRRIIRRALRHGSGAGAQGPFLYKLVRSLADIMGSVGCKIREQQLIIEKTLHAEEEKFGRTLEKGLVILNEAMDGLSNELLDGETVFKFYDTYGFPIDLTREIASERGLSIDEAGFRMAMERQQKRARALNQFSTDYSHRIKVDINSRFIGYSLTECQGTIAKVVLQDNAEDLPPAAGKKATIILDKTPFYSESGGQCSDTGTIRNSGGLFKVYDTQKLGNAIAHHGALSEGNLSEGEVVYSAVDAARRRSISLNHSATHLTHAALRHILGTHVVQKGSQIKEDAFRFDFFHSKPISQVELQEIEFLVNAQIRANQCVRVSTMDLEAAKKKGALALFNERYGERVRVLSIGDFSTELCGGTHAINTGDIGLFKILSESSIASGIRRIEATTGENALRKIASQYSEYDTKIDSMIAKTKQLGREIQRLKEKLVSQVGFNLAHQVRDIAGFNVLVTQLDDTEEKMLCSIVNDLKNRIGSGIIVLCSVLSTKISLVVGVTEDLTGRIKAGDLVSMVAQQVDGRGGGRPGMAQAAGTNLEALPAALKSVEVWLARERPRVDLPKPQVNRL